VSAAVPSAETTATLPAPAGHGAAATALAAAPHVDEERAATSVPTGRLGIWWFLASEIVIFGGLITCYVLFRIRHPEWGSWPRTRSRPRGR